MKYLGYAPSTRGEGNNSEKRETGVLDGSDGFDDCKILPVTLRSARSFQIGRAKYRKRGKLVTASDRTRLEGIGRILERDRGAFPLPGD